MVANMLAYLLTLFLLALDTRSFFCIPQWITTSVYKEIGLSVIGPYVHPLMLKSCENCKEYL